MLKVFNGFNGWCAKDWQAFESKDPYKVVYLSEYDLEKLSLELNRDLFEEDLEIELDKSLIKKYDLTRFKDLVNTCDDYNLDYTFIFETVDWQSVDSLVYELDYDELDDDQKLSLDDED